ncbi:MAG: NADH-quinone oxidoreductase subunit G [Gammaproteobacteria bacterium]|nr:NADH-quinone oxidoreductase subunit G [Gammaproteobacteria bacterium]
MTDDIITIEIDGRTLQARKGQTVIQVADEAGIHIPRFCYHKKLSVAANCRMCLVEMEKAPKPVAACATPVMAGMKIKTRSEQAREAQKGVMEFLLINHPLDCPICDQGGECELQDLALGYGKDVSRFTEAKRVVFDEDIGPLVSTDMTRCIHCTRCVRFGEEIAGLRELGATGRGENMRIGTYVKKAMASELSGNVIDVCPVGALNNKPYRFSARTWELSQHAVISPHDCVGSNFYLHTLRGKVQRAVPRENEAINETWLADRDRFSCHGIYSEQRIAQPQLKERGKWRKVSWDEAIEVTVERLQSVIASRGSETIGALISPSATLEEHYLFQCLLRGIGSSNIDHRLQQCDFSHDETMPVAPWLGMDLNAVENLQAVLIVGGNPRKDQPLLGHRLRKAALRGAAIMYVNHRAYDLNHLAEQYLAATCDDLVIQLAAIAKALMQKTNRAVPDALQGLLEQVEVDEQQKTIAENLHKADRALVLIGSQASLSPLYSYIVALSHCIASLASVSFGTIHIGANATGACLAGALPHRKVAGTADEQPGLSAHKMLQSARRAYLLFNVEPELEAWDTATAHRAMHEAEAIIAISNFASPTMREYADILLPLASFAETDGTYINAEGRWQSFTAAAKIQDDAQPGWKILRLLADRLNVSDLAFNSAAAISKVLREQCRNVVLNNTVANIKLPQHDFSAHNRRLQRIADIPIYSTDAVVRRSLPLQQTIDGMEADKASIHPQTAAEYKLETSEYVSVTQNGNTIEFSLQLNEAIPEGCIWIGLGVPGTEALGPAFGDIEVSAS